MKLLTKKEVAIELEVALSTVHRRLKRNDIPPPDCYSENGGMWYQWKIQMIAEVDKVNKIDLDTVKELAKTKTVPEISKIIGISENRIRSFCIKNGIERKLCRPGRFKKTKEVAEVKSSQKEQGDLFRFSLFLFVSAYLKNRRLKNASEK